MSEKDLQAVIWCHLALHATVPAELAQLVVKRFRRAMFLGLVGSLVQPTEHWYIDECADMKVAGTVEGDDVFVHHPETAYQFSDLAAAQRHAPGSSIWT